MGNDLQDNNLKEVIRSLEVLIQSEIDPTKKCVYEEKLVEYRKQLSDLSKSAKAAD